MACAWPSAPPKMRRASSQGRSFAPVPNGHAAVDRLPSIVGSGLTSRSSFAIGQQSDARVSSWSGPPPRTSSMRLTPSMAHIADRDVVIELQGFPVPLPFKVGGKYGNVVTKSSANTVHRGWRIVGVAGHRLAAKDVAGALAAASQQHGRYAVTFRMGEPEGDEGTVDEPVLSERARRQAEQADVERREADEVARIRKEAEEAERMRKEVEDAARRRREAAEADRKRKEAEEEERRRREAEEAERLRQKRAEEERKRYEAARAEEERREAEEVERRRQEAEEERKRREAEAREQEEERQRREAEAERQRRDAEELERIRREAEEAECRRRAAEEFERKRREVEEAERERREAEEVERKQKEAEEIERKRREDEEVERRRMEAERAERKRMEEQAEKKRREADEAERQRQESEDAERTRRAAVLAARKKQEAEEAERNRKKVEEAERKRQAAVQAEVDRRRKEAEEAAQRQRREQEVAEAAQKAAADAEAAERRRQEAEEEAERQRQIAELAEMRHRSEKKLQQATGLPPKDKVAEPQKALLAALTSKRISDPPQKKKPTGPCDKCDGPHATDDCPHFKKDRVKHKDAFERYGKKGGGDEGAGSVILRSAKVVRQPGDGSCLFHSMSYGLRSRNASALRAEIADFVAANPNALVGDNPIKDWVLWDSGLDVTSYARSMRSGSRWGGAVEIAVCAKVKEVQVDVYERCNGGFSRISSFEGDAGSANGTVNLLYGGRVHYDALQV